MAQGKPKTLDAALAQVTSAPYIRCKTCKLPPDLRVDVEQRAKTGTDAETLARALRSMGHFLSAFSLRRHMRGECEPQAATR